MIIASKGGSSSPKPAGGSFSGPGLLGSPGKLVRIAGYVVDRLMAAGFSPVNSRKLPIIIGLIGMAVFTFLAAETPSNAYAAD